MKEGIVKAAITHVCMLSIKTLNCRRGKHTKKNVLDRMANKTLFRKFSVSGELRGYSTIDRSDRGVSRVVYRFPSACVTITMYVYVR